jgi:hypothetical protein
MDVVNGIHAVGRQCIMLKKKYVPYPRIKGVFKHVIKPTNAHV